MSRTDDTRGEGRFGRAPHLLKLASVLLFFVAGVALLVRTMGGARSFVYPMIYSQALIIAVLIMLAMLFWKVLAETRVAGPEGGAAADGDRRATRPLLPFVALGVCIAYILLWNWLGHALATVAFMISMLLIARERNPILLPVMGLLFPAVIWYVFDQLLRIPLPEAAFL